MPYAVENSDLDTMRACYMIEAYTDMGAGDVQPEQQQQQQPQQQQSQQLPQQLSSQSASRSGAGGEVPQKEHHSSVAGHTSAGVQRGGVVVAPIYPAGQNWQNPPSQSQPTSQSMPLDKSLGAKSGESELPADGTVAHMIPLALELETAAVGA